MRLSLILRNSSKLPKNYTNFPDRFVKRQTEFIEWETPKLPQYQRRTVRWRKRAYYDIHRPWSQEFQNMNAPNMKLPVIYVQPIKEWFMFRGDRVEILNGKDKGKHGLVNFVVKERNWVCVEGLNCDYVKQNDSQDYYGFITVNEKPLLVPRDVALVDPSDQKPTTIEWRYDEEGNKVRVSLRTGRIIPIPTVAQETIDFKMKEIYIEQPKDTAAEHIKKVSFVPKIKTFEMEIMDEMGIKEEKIPYPMFWY